MTHRLPERDLDHILTHTRGIWEELRDSRLFVTGGTGLFGRWMLESFLRANDLLGLRAEAIVLTRNPRRAARSAPHVMGHPAITLWEGDVRSFAYPLQECTHVLHMATETVLDTSAAASFETAIKGTERVLGLAAVRATRRFLYTSSGAVYGIQPPDCERVEEEYAGAPRPEDVSRGYGHGKRAAEFLCAVAAEESGLEVKIARCFALVGPLLPLDINFAIGNFIRDALYRGYIELTGDGTPRRSYLYAADLAVWLWTILMKGQSARPYNVGSEEDISILDLARLVARLLKPGIEIRVAQQPTAGARPPRYVPSTVRAATELGLQNRVSLDDAILRTAHWYLAKQETSPQDGLP